MPMANNRSRGGLHAFAALALVAGCASAPPGGEPAPRPVERVSIQSQFAPRVEWKVTGNSTVAGGELLGAGVVGAAQACVFTGPLAVACLPVAIPVGLLVGGAVALVAGARGADNSGVPPSDKRVIDLRNVAGALDLGPRLRQSVTRAGWRVQEDDAVPAVRLAARIERIRVLSTVPIRSLWVHEMEVSWTVTEGADADAPVIAQGRFLHERVLGFTLRHDEASGTWIGEDDGRFAAAWTQARDEIADRIVREAAPAIAAHRH